MTPTPRTAYRFDQETLDMIEADRKGQTATSYLRELIHNAHHAQRPSETPRSLSGTNPHPSRIKPTQGNTEGAGELLPPRTPIASRLHPSLRNLSLVREDVQPVPKKKPPEARDDP